MGSSQSSNRSNKKKKKSKSKKSIIYEVTEKNEESKIVQLHVIEPSPKPCNPESQEFKDAMEIARCEEISGNFKEAAFQYELCFALSSNKDPQPLLCLSELLLNKILPGIDSVEQRRLIEAQCSVYLEIAVNVEDFDSSSFPSFCHLSDLFGSSDDDLLSTNWTEGDLASGNDCSAFVESNVPSVVELVMKGKGLESLQDSNETIAQRRLRFAQAARNFEMAALLFQLVGEPAHAAEAQALIANHYLHGYGIDVSEPMMQDQACRQAVEYLASASKFSNKAACEWAKLIASGEVPNQDLPPRELCSLCHALLEKSALFGNIGASRMLAELLEAGMEPAESSPKERYSRAASLFQDIAEMEGSDAKLLSQKAERLKMWIGAADHEKDLQEPGFLLFCNKYTDFAWNHAGKAVLQKGAFDLLSKWSDQQALDLPVSESTCHAVGDLLFVLPQPKIEGEGKKGDTTVAQIRNELRHHSDSLGWNEVDFSELLENSGLSKLRTEVEKLRLPYDRIVNSSEAAKLLEIRLEEISDAIDGLDLLSLERFVSQATSYKKEATSLSLKCQAVARRIPCFRRSLDEQNQLFDFVEEISKQMIIGFDKALKYAPLAMQLEKESLDVQRSVMKHFRSARSLTKAANSRGISIEEARQQIEKEAQEVVGDLFPPNFPFFGAMGYDVLLHLHDWNELQERALRLANEESQRRVNERISEIMKQTAVNEEWFLSPSSQHQIRMAALFSILLPDEVVTEIIQETEAAKGIEISVIVSGSSTNNSLLAINQRAVETLTSIDKHHGNIPRIHIPALTFADPWLRLIHAEFHSAFDDIIAGAREADSERNIEERFEEILLQELKLKFSLIRNQIEEEESKTQLKNLAKILKNDSLHRKKQALFCLRTALDMDWSSPQDEDLVTLGNHLISGAGGRCPDGVGSFFNWWICQILIEHHKLPDDFAAEDREKLQIQIAMASFVLELKRVYIEKHGSLFQYGKNIGKYDAAEDRTAMTTLLSTVLSLPLSLLFEPNVIHFPSFAVRTLQDYEDVLRIESLITRFVKGGSITHKDDRTVWSNENQVNCLEKDFEMTTQFEPLTLEVLGRQFRESLTEGKTTNPIGLEGILPTPNPDITLNESMLASFIENDKVLSASWDRLKSSHFTQSNTFFDAQAAEQEGGNALRNVMRDSAILRVFEVAGYAIVPEGFYRNVHREWSFSSLCNQPQ